MMMDAEQPVAGGAAPEHVSRRSLVEEQTSTSVPLSVFDFDLIFILIRFDLILNF